MKKIYLLIALATLSIVGFAQETFNGITPLKTTYRMPISVPEKPAFSGNRVQPGFSIDYDFAEATIYGAPGATPGAGYRAFIYDVNHNYVAADSSTKYVIVAFDSILDVNNGVGYAPGGYTSIRVDSIQANVGHVNISGTNDTIVFKIIGLGANGYPSTTVYDTTQIVTSTSLSPGGNWYVATTVLTLPNFTLPSGVKKFGVQLEYHGAKQDTLGLVAGYNDQGGPCGASQYWPTNSLFYPNSYRNVTQYFAANGLLPATNGNDYFVDCNGNGFDATDANSFFQNAQIWVYVTLGGVSIDEDFEKTGIKVFQNTPNPASKSTSIAYETAANGNVSLNIFNVAGKEVLYINEGNKAAGKHNIKLNTSSLSSGVYYYTLNAGENKITKKMVIIE